MQGALLMLLTSCSAGGTGQGRGAQRHRRSSLGGGGVAPFAGHSFLLTAYDEKQKECICQKIIRLGGHVQNDVPKPQVAAYAACHSVHALYSYPPSCQ